MSTVNTSCGPSIFPQKLNNFLFGWFFEASCKKHDEGYKEGGSEFRRWYCDYRFLKAMLKDTVNTKDWTAIVKGPVALGYYFAVVIAGPFRFNYK